MNAPIDISGNRFGLLVAISEADKIKGRRAYNCKCDCGSNTVVRVESLRAGITKSCGCIRSERIGNLNKSHQMCDSPEYKSWSHAKQRVMNKNDKKYINYGGRGIKMCDRWFNSFENFYSDLGNKPSSKHTIGRIDVNGDYCPENCRWENHSQQARERTDNVYVFVDNEKMILKDACKKLNIKYKNASHLIKNKFLSFDELRIKYGV